MFKIYIYKYMRNLPVFQDVYSLQAFCHIRRFVLMRFLSLDVLSVYVLSDQTFCPYTFCRIIPYFLLDVLSVYVLSHYTFCRYMFCRFTFCRYTFCRYTFRPLDVLLLYVLSLNPCNIRRYGTGVRSDQDFWRKLNCCVEEIWSPKSL